VTELGAVADATGEPAGIHSVLECLGELSDAQARLHSDFERLAAAVGPFLTKQFSDTERRMRVLETRLRNRQERPLIVHMAGLLADVRRLESGEDIKAHVEEAILSALTSLGYQEMGREGDQFDPGWHEPVAGSVGKAGIVTRVHRRGLACHGDVIIKAKVEVEPAPAGETETAADNEPASSESGDSRP
jgi:hypothetical protein